MQDCIDHGKRGTSKGYHSTTRSVGGVRVQGHAHRMVYCEHAKVSWESIRGLVVRHRCDNPRCINPEHLEIGTVYDNNQDRHKRGRDAVGAANGNCKWPDSVIEAVRVLRGKSVRYIARATGVPKSTVHQILSGEIRNVPNRAHPRCGD